MSLMVHNTLTNSKEEFVTIEPGKVKMYVCGVTVYDDIHMGHARSMIVFDTVARYLRYLGYEVTHVTNFTDVDDKIIKRAAERGVEPLELSAEYIRRYFEDAEKLGINRADIYPKASECIGDIISMVQKIIDSGYGYVTEDGSVYFSVRKVKDYGKLSKRRLEDMRQSDRIQSGAKKLDENKEDPMDFAVWKAAKPGECSWDSPWGPGRPGWHIECSAMIDKFLGQQIDIHGGGNDLIFPHHENEILQTEAVTGRMLANYWMHNGMLIVRGQGMSEAEKMSKSKGNFFTVKDVASRFDPQTIRFYFLNAHYMSELEYGESILEESKAALSRLVNNYRDLCACARDGPEGGPEEDDCCDSIESYRKAFRDAMDDDFNTRAAIETMFQMARATNKAMGEKAMTRKAARRYVKLLDEFNGILNIIPGEEKADDGTLDAVMSILVDLRADLRKNKMYQYADMIRDRLAEAGIRLEDSADGVKWTKV